MNSIRISWILKVVGLVVLIASLLLPAFRRSDPGRIDKLPPSARAVLLTVLALLVAVQLYALSVALNRANDALEQQRKSEPRVWRGKIIRETTEGEPCATQAQCWNL